jgi:DNA polymerase III delta subunit
MAERKSTDPAAEMRALVAGLQGGGAPARAYLLRGEERWFREQAIAALRARAHALEWELCAHDTADPDFSLSALIDDLSSSSMFSSARAVVLRGTTRERSDLFAKTDGGKPSALARAVLGWLEGGGSGCFVLSADSMRADHAVAKAIQKAGGTLADFRKLYDSPAPWKPDPRQTELVQWLLARAKEKGIRLLPDDALYLAAMTGNDLAALDGGLDKLALAGPGGVRAIAVPQASTSPWAVAEQLVGGDLQRALFGLETLFHNGFEEKDGRRLVDPSALLGMLLPTVVRSARAGLAASECLATGGTPDAAAASAGFSGPPQRVAEALERARARVPRQWRKLLGDATDLERRMKTGGTVDVNDLALFALQHRTRPARPALKPRR